MNFDLPSGEPGPVYAFCEIVLDGTTKPFKEALADFHASQEAAGCKPAILAMKPDERKLLAFFGQRGMKEGDELQVPEGWHDLLGKTAIWHEHGRN